MTFGDQFLTYPDLFPARAAGAAWGETRIAIDLAGGPYRFSGLSPGQAAVVRARFGPLLPAGDGDPAPGIETRVFQVAEEEFRPCDVPGWTFTLDVLHEPAAVRVAGLRFMARLEWRPGLAAAVWTSVGEGRGFEGVFENLLRLLVAYSLVEGGGAVVHGAAVVDGEGAYLFFGPSGAGKSTLSRAAQGAGRTVLNDDLNLLAWREGGAVVEPVPFTGDRRLTQAGGKPWPVRALCRLEKGARVEVAAMTPARALAALLACSPYVNTDPHRRPRLEANLERFVRALPALTLTWPREAGFEEIAAGLEAGP